MKLDCGNCGAILSVDEFLEFLKCDYCSTLHFPSWTTESLSLDLIHDQCEEHCPICDQCLVNGKIGITEISACNQCHGMLINSKNLLHLIRYLRQDRADSRRKPNPLNDEDLSREIECPKCDISMFANPYYGPGDYVIDYCQNCKYVWLDGGELKKSVTIEWNGSVWK